MTEQIQALLEERRGYVQRGLVDRVKQVDAMLSALGHVAKTEKPKTRKAVKRMEDTSTATIFEDKD